jgi:hypothetical protein
MMSRSTKIKTGLIVMAIVVLLIPFLYPTCPIGKEQLLVSIPSTKWIVGPEGGILTMKISIKNSAECNASVESLQFTMYRLIYSDNTTEDVDLSDTQVIHTVIPAGGETVINFAFAQPFRVGPRSILAKIALILEDGSSLDVFDGPIETTTPA